MVIDATDPSELAVAAANGATHGLVQVFWDQCQSTSGGAVTATGVIANINNVIAAGLKVTLRVSLQYIPTFVDTAAVKFRRNGGVDYNPGNLSGNNARDWVWSASTRALVDDFLTKLFNQLDWTKIDRVQLGGGPAGELKYPVSNQPVSSDSDVYWWGFSAPAQTGVGLAAGQVVCPVPGHVPSTGTTWTADDISFVNWYTTGLNNWMLWLIAKHRAYFAGPIWVMHPGAGLRPVSQTPTGGQALNYRANVAEGVHWAAQIAAYPDAAVHPYSTWADGVHFWPPDPFSDVNDGNAAAWYHLLRTARALGRATRIWGENTGNNTNSDMDRVFSDGAVAHGYQGLTWLSHDSLASSTDDSYANFAVRIAVANKAFGGGVYNRGVNMAGGEFSHDADHLPGVYGTDYAYDSAVSMANVATRNHKIVRLPIRWERIQPTRGAALNSAELARITQVIADVQAAGMRVVLDLHNYGEYINSTANGGATLRLGGALPTADLVDLWTRLSTAFKLNSGVYGYDLMNEPHDLSGPIGTFSGTTRYDWVSGVQGWTGDSASVSNVGAKLRFALTPPSTAFYNTRKDDAGADRNGPVTGNVLQAECTLAAGTPGTWSVRLQWQDTSFTWLNAPTVTYTRTDTGATVSSLIAGVPVLVRAVFATNIPTGRPFAIQIESGAPTAGSYTCDVDNFAHGTLTGAANGNQFWEQVSNQVGAAIRANGDETLIILEGHGWSSSKEWVNNHPSAWATFGGKIAYGPHYYFDSDNSGDYPDSYATENAAAVTAGYTNLSSRVAREVSPVLQWAVRNGVRLFFGETGWTNTADTASWNAVGETLYSEFDRYAVDVTYWAAGERWGSGYNLSIYTGTTQTTIKAQATVVEAHPSTDTAAVPPPPPPPPPPPAPPVAPASGAERNLFPNPALANNATGWTSVLGGYVRYSAAGTAGKVTDGTGSSLSSATRVFVSQGTPTVTGALISGVARANLDAAGSSAMRFVVYADAAGEPGALLASSDELTVTNTTEQALTFPFSGVNQVTLNNGTNYWLGLAWVDPGTPSVSISRDSTAALRREQTWTPPTLPNPYGTALTSGTGPIDAFVNVAPGTLPRATGWTGTAADDSNTPRAQTPATTGVSYVYSVSIEAVAAQSFNMVVNFYNASSGGTFLGNSGATVPVVLGAGQSQRFILGPYTPPAGTVSSHLKFNDIDAGGVRITAIRCTPSSGSLARDGEYFDGFTPGAVWDGTPGDSTSTRLTFLEKVTATDTFTIQETALGPVFSDLVHATDTFTGVSFGTFADQAHATDGFLIAELEYDEFRGRTRVSAFTFSDRVTQVVVRRRVVGGKLVDVRGGTVSVFDGVMVRPVDDYEFPAGVDVEYVIEGLSDTGVVVQTAVARRMAAGDVAWLKFVANPQLNRKIDLVGWSATKRSSRQVLYEVIGQSEPVVVTDVHTSRQVSIEIVTHTPEATESLDDALREGHPVFLQIPRGLQLRTMYASVGDYECEPLKLSSPRSRWTLPLTEVAAPPFTLTGNVSTYATLLTQHTTYAALLAAHDHYRELVA
jgi:hypothetical protein